MKKLCSKCKLPKEPEEFHKKSKNTDGLRRICKYCMRKYNHNRYVKQKRKQKRKVEMAIKVLKAFEQEAPEIYQKVIQEINDRPAVTDRP